MTPKILLACVAAAGLAAGAAQAGTHHTSAHGAGAYASPTQPIAYSDLNAYMKATPKQRVARNWTGGAATGASVNTSAARPATNTPGNPDATTSTQAPNAGMNSSDMGNPDTQAAPTQPVNPAMPATPATSQPPAASTMQQPAQ